MRQGPLIIASAIGGVTIEDIAHEHPDMIIRHPINIQKGLSAEDVRRRVWGHPM